MPTLSFFEDLFSSFQIAFFIADFFDSEKIYSPDTPATVSCKEKLLMVVPNSLLIVLLDIWGQNILVFSEEWVGRLLDFPTIGVVERNV
jgi:hypothetical protein